MAISRMSDCSHVPKGEAGGGMSGKREVPNTSTSRIRGPSTVTRSVTGMDGVSSSERPQEYSGM